MPPDLKLRYGTTKYILKKALDPLLSKEILHRKKQGFAVPVGKWFREGKICFRERVAPVRWDGDFVRRRLSEHQQDEADNRLFLWDYWALNHMPLEI